MLLFRTCVAMAIVTSCNIPPLAAQYTTGRLEGAVTDPSEAGVSGATVTLLNLETNAMRKQDTGSEGAYFFGAVSPGRYRVSAEKAGFDRVAAELTVTTSEILRRDFQLRIAGAQ